jgi:hypothetical protein
MMNERIKELMNQAAKQYYVGTGEIKPNDMMYIFAELIIQECADFVSETATIETLLGDRLKEHFGVEL